MFYTKADMLRFLSDKVTLSRIEHIMTLSGNEYYKDIQLDSEPICSNVTVSPYGEQTCYTAEGDGDHTVDFNFTAVDNNPVYAYFRTENEKS